MSQVDGTLNGRYLGSVVIIVFIALGLVLISPDQTISKIIETIGDLISRAFA